MFTYRKVGYDIETGGARLEKESLYSFIGNRMQRLKFISEKKESISGLKVTGMQ